jgi:hypothetical protein
MTLVDLIELLGASVDAGLMPLDEAVQRVVEFSEGGLTHLGAADSLRRHRTIRASYARIFDDAKASLHALDAVQAAVTPQEKAHAGLALAVETTLQRAAMTERMKQQLLDDLHRRHTTDSPDSYGDQR